MGSRLYFIDWLRVLAVLLLFPFHTGRVFNAGEAFYVKGQQLSAAMGHVLSFISVWHMQLLFALAGASTYLALGRRTRAEYGKERVKRLLVPLVFGLFVLIPPQTWFGARFNTGYEGSYLHYLTGGDFLQIDFGKDDYYGGFGTGHLWFILFLFIIAMAALPLWRGRHRKGSRPAVISRLLSHPAAWPLAGLAILLGEALPEIGGKNIFYYFVFFVLGYLAVCAPEFMESAVRHRWLALGLGVPVAIWWVATVSWRDGLPDPSIGLFLVVLAGMTAAWMIIIGLLGLGRVRLNRRSRSLTYLAEGSYPVYILHQTVIVIVAFYVVDLEVAWFVQWVLLLAVSIVLTFVCYEAMRRVNALRLLFGMRPRPGVRRPTMGSHRMRPQTESPPQRR